MHSPTAATHFSDDNDNRKHSPPEAIQSGEGYDSYEDQEEEEEEEVEEEEVEDGNEDEDDIEVEEEVGGDDDPTGSPIADDVIQSVEFERHDKNLRSYSVTQEKAEVSLPSDTFVIVGSSGNSKSSGPSNEQLDAPIGELCMYDKVSNHPKLGKHLVNFEDKGIQESTVGEKGAFHSEEGMKQISLQSKDIKERASRLAAPQIRLRSLSPDTKFVEGTKQAVAICDFFAKGWCIKGNSCKFLHTKDHSDNAGQQPQRNVAAAKWKNEVQIDEGLTDSTEKSGSSGLHDPLPFSFNNGRDSHRLELCPDNYSNSASRFAKCSSNGIGNSLFSEYGSLPNHSVISSSIYRSGGTQSCSAGTLDELTKKRSLSPFNVHTSPISSCYLSSGPNSSLPTIGMLPSNRVSAWMASSLSYGSSSLMADSFNTHKILNRNAEFLASRSTSLFRSSSPFSGSEPQTTVPSTSAHKRKFSPNDWEPSKPFRPSFFISLPGMSSPGSQYDPLRDGIEQSNTVDGSFKVYTYADPDLNRTLCPEYNADKHSIASHDKSQDSVLDKDCFTHEKSFSITEAEAAGSSVHDQENGNIVPKGEKPLVPTHVRDVSETNKINDGLNLTHHSNGDRHSKELRVDRGRQIDEMVVDHKTDADVHKDSKALRHFRAALIDSVKELLKPAWREGRVSKDAHNMIVKKAVDKVLSTLEPHQIPSTVDFIKQYLSFSGPKLSKLVEGYVDKYGKS